MNLERPGGEGDVLHRGRCRLQIVKYHLVGIIGVNYLKSGQKRMTLPAPQARRLLRPALGIYLPADLRVGPPPSSEVQ